MRCINNFIPGQKISSFKHFTQTFFITNVYTRITVIFGNQRLASAFYERSHDCFFISWKDFFILYFISFDMMYSYSRLIKMLGIIYTLNVMKSTAFRYSYMDCHATLLTCRESWNHRKSAKIVEHAG